MANATAISSIFAAGTPLIFEAHAGVYWAQCFFSAAILLAVVSSAFSVAWTNFMNASPRPLYRLFSRTTLLMARRTAQSPPGLIGTHSSDLAAVFDILTSKVTSFAPRSTFARMTRCATGMWLVWVSRMLLPKFSM